VKKKPNVPSVLGRGGPRAPTAHAITRESAQIRLCGEKVVGRPARPPRQGRMMRAVIQVHVLLVTRSYVSGLVIAAPPAKSQRPAVSIAHPILSYLRRSLPLSLSSHQAMAAAAVRQGLVRYVVVLVGMPRPSTCWSHLHPSLLDDLNLNRWPPPTVIVRRPEF
jgi:hypothetical protein